MKEHSKTMSIERLLEKRKRLQDEAKAHILPILTTKNRESPKEVKLNPTEKGSFNNFNIK